MGLNNYSAAYATGLLLARRVLTKFGLDKTYLGCEEPDGEDYNVDAADEGPRPFYCLLDAGLKRTSTGAKTFGALKVSRAARGGSARGARVGSRAARESAAGQRGSSSSSSRGAAHTAQGWQVLAAAAACCSSDCSSGGVATGLAASSSACRGPPPARLAPPPLPLAPRSPPCQGALDGGLAIPHNEKRFVGWTKEDGLEAEVLKKYIYGGHVAEYMEEMEEEDPEKYNRHFAAYIEEGLGADDLEELYTKVGARFEGGGGAGGRQLRRWQPPGLMQQQQQ